MGNIVTLVLSYRLSKCQKEEKIKKKQKKKIYVIIYMANVISKMCWIISQPIRYYEKKRVKKVYKEVFQDDVWDSTIYSHEMSI